MKTPGEQNLDAIILGAGLTGLTAAATLRQDGASVLLLEKSSRVGGAIATIEEGGFRVETGPNTFLLNEARWETLFSKIGLKSQSIEADPAAKKRYIVRHGRPHAVPGHPLAALTSPLFSNRGLLRVLADPLRRPLPGGKERSLARLVRHRFGHEILDYAVDPFVNGIYAGDPERLSFEIAFPRLAAAEKRGGGSLLRGFLRARADRKQSGEPPFRSRIISFREGLEALPRALAQHVDNSLLTGTRVRDIHFDSHRKVWRLTIQTTGNAAARTVSAPHLVVGIPAFAIPALPFSGELRSALECFREIEYPPVANIALGFPRTAVEHPLDGFGMLVPSRESFFILGTLFSSSLFPGRAPDGSVLLTSFVGGSRHPSRADLPESEMIEAVSADLHRLLGVRGKPVFAHIARWPRAIPQFNLGYERFLQHMEKLETEWPGLHFGGHYRDGISLPNCLGAGVRLARSITGSVD